MGSGLWLSKPKVVAEDRKHPPVGRHQIFSELFIVVIEQPFELRSSLSIHLQQIIRSVCRFARFLAETLPFCVRGGTNLLP